MDIENKDMNNAEIPEEVSAEKKKKKIPLAGKIGIIVLAVVVVIGGGALLYAQHILGKIERIDPENEHVMTPEEAAQFILEDDEDELGIDPAEEDPEEQEPDLNNADIKLVTDPDVTNVLFIGVDASGSSFSGRSDTIMICSINNKTGKITLLSILRDLYVEIEGYQNNKINASFAFGGTRLLNKTIEKNLGVRIDYNVQINFDGFVRAMSKVGSLDISLSKAEVEYLNGKHPTWNLKEGTNTLNSNQLLAYARIRKIAGADWGRTERQRKVITAAFNKYRSKGITAMLDLINKVTPYIRTDMTNGQIVSMARSVFASGMNIGKAVAVPTGDTYRAMYVRGRAVLVPDMAAVSRQIHQYLYGVD